jgi:hypothetical protein
MKIVGKSQLAVSTMMSRNVDTCIAPKSI